MNRPAVFVVLALAAAALIVAALYLPGGDGPDAAHVAPMADAVDTASLLVPPPSTPRSAAAERVAAEPPSAPDVATAAAADPTPSTVSVSGLVLDRDGAPSVGADVRLRSAEGQRWRDAMLVVADDDGRFSFDTLEPGVDVELAVGRVGSSIPHGDPVRASPPRADIVLVDPRVRVVVRLIVSPELRDLIQPSGGVNGMMTTHFGKHGTVRGGELPLEQVLWVDHGAELRIECTGAWDPVAMTVPVGAMGARQVVDVELVRRGPAAKVVVRLVDPFGGPVDDARVWISRAPGDPGSDRPFASESGGSASEDAVITALAMKRTDDGDHSLRFVEPGRYVARIEPDEDSMLVGHEFDVELPALEDTVLREEVRVGGRLRIRSSNGEVRRVRIRRVDATTATFEYAKLRDVGEPGAPVGTMELAAPLDPGDYLLSFGDDEEAAVRVTLVAGQVTLVDAPG